MSFVNELEESDLLMTGSSDGVIRVWRKYSEPKPLLSTAWRAHKQPENSYGLCHLWNQTHGTVVFISPLLPPFPLASSLSFFFFPILFIFPFLFQAYCGRIPNNENVGR